MVRLSRWNQVSAERFRRLAQADLRPVWRHGIAAPRGWGPVTNSVWMVTPPEKGAEPIFFALCREHGRELRRAEAKYAADGYRIDVVRNSLAIVRLRREAGGSRHLRACIRCGAESGI